MSLNFLNVHDLRYHIPYPLSIFLRGGPGYLGDFLESTKRENEHWMHSAEILRGNYQGPSLEDETLDAKNVAQTLTNVEASSHDAAESIWTHLQPTLSSSTVCSIGGGNVLYSDLLLYRAPWASAMIVDLLPQSTIRNSTG